MYKQMCIVCGEEFESLNSEDSVCSEECQDELDEDLDSEDDSDFDDEDDSEA